MAGRANGGSRNGAITAANVFDDLDAGWDEVPESTAVPIRHPASAIVLPKSVLLSGSSVVGDVDEPTLEIGETFADDVDLADVEESRVLEVRDDELFEVLRGVNASRVRVVNLRRGVRR